MTRSKVLADLRREYDAGDISCLAIAVVRPTGELSTVITGWAARSEALDSLPGETRLQA